MRVRCGISILLLQTSSYCNFRDMCHESYILHFYPEMRSMNTDRIPNDSLSINIVFKMVVPEGKIVDWKNTTKAKFNQ